MAGFVWSLRIQWQQGIALETRVSPATRFHREANDEDSCQTGTDQNRDGENVHACSETDQRTSRIASFAIDCAYFISKICRRI
jgi:hypothetical protein